MTLQESSSCAALELQRGEGPRRPLVIDLYCGLGGWAEGFLSEGYSVIGFDVERHDYGTGGYPGQLVLQDVTTLHGSQFKGAAVIVASPPCQAYSRRAMPFGALWREHNRMDDDGAPAGNYQGKNPIFNDLFRTCFRLQREASHAAGRHIPMIVENVKGAEAFVGPAAWHFESYFLWGDVPALMPIGRSRKGSKGIANGSAPGGTGNSSWFYGKRADPRDVRKTPDGNWELADGTKMGGGWWNDSTNNLLRKASSRSVARKAASAKIAKIPPPLSQWIAQVFKP